MKRGRKYDNDIDRRITDLLTDAQIATPETIRKAYKKRYGKLLNWITVKNHLENMHREGFINKRVISKGIKRSIVIYEIN